MPSEPFKPESVCILRLSALGDVTHVIPVVRQLQEQLPETRITWIIGSLERRLLQGLDGVEFIVFDKRGGWLAVKKLRDALAHRRFDVLLHMQVAARANLLSCLISAPVRIGWNRKRSRDFHRWFINQNVADVPFQHQTEGFLEFGRALGLSAAAPEWSLPISQDARNWAKQHFEPDHPVLLISPCSSHPLRNWNAKNYAAVADFAAGELRMQVVLSGGPSEMEKDTGTRIEHHMRHNCINLISQDTLEQSKALLAHAALVISPDSGPAHIASALGTPVLGLYAATWSRRSGPYNSLNLCVDRFPEAARRFRRSEPEKLRWGTRIEVPGVMDLIPVEAVITQLQQWWENRLQSQR